MDRYRRLGLSERAARVLLDAPWQGLFDALSPRQPEAARRLASALERRLVHHWRRTGERELPAADRLAPLVRAVEQQRIRPEAFDEIFDRLLDEPRREAASILAGYTPSDGDAAALDDLVDEVATRRDEVAGKPDDAILRWGMRHAMRPMLGKVSPSDVRERLIRALELEEVHP